MGCIFVLGGARSGKSSVAEQIAERTAASLQVSVTYLATAQRSDVEMDARIARHQALRPTGWRTVEEPLEVATWLKTAPQGVVLLDCLSLLLNNWLFLESATDAHLKARMEALVAAVREYSGTVVMVSNEVGQGIVPGDPLSRRYRDWLGWLNQSAAAEAEQVYLVVAGIPIDVRKWQATW